MDIEKAEGIIKAARLIQRISEMLNEGPYEENSGQLLRERHFLLGLIAGMRDDRVEEALADTEDYLEALRLRQK